MKLILLCSMLSCVFTYQWSQHFDFVEDALSKYVNHSMNPCENFYRHACSTDSPNDLVSSAFSSLFSYLNKIEESNFWNSMTFQNDYKTFEQRKDLPSYNETVEELFLNIKQIACKRNSSETVLRNKSQLCLMVKESLNSFIYDWSRNTVELMKDFNKRLQSVIDLLQGINAIWKVDVRRGIEETRNMLIASLKIAVESIKDTPWATNSRQSKAIERITKRLTLHDNYGKELQMYTNILFSIEKSYTECKLNFHTVENGDMFCYITNAITPDIKVLEPEHFFIFDNGYNLHPDIYLGYPSYYYAQYGNEMASKLGVTGFTVSHEIGHTFINTPPETTLPYFSGEAIDCIQRQHNRTCVEYKEKSCATSLNFLDDNGADIFGLQLAYKQLENYYGNSIDDMIDRLNVTNRQLFFYAYALYQCSGEPSYVNPEDEWTPREHSASNVRVNIVAQHPGFKEAFKCSPDSRMMKSATEQCIIYGKEAPGSKKRS